MIEYPPIALVTGGAGFIGSHVAEQAALAGYRVVILDNLSTGKTKRISYLKSKYGVKFIKGDVRDLGTVLDATLCASVIFHLAALISVPDSVKNPDEYRMVNYIGTNKIVEAAILRRVKRIVFSSSAAVYGASEEILLSESDRTAPCSPYGQSKLEAEELLRLQSKYVDAVSLRYFNVYGPGQVLPRGYGAVIPSFITKARLRQRPIIFEDGMQMRDFCHVRDVAAANIAAAKFEYPFYGTVYNIASGEAITILELWNIIAELSGCSKLSPHYRPSRPGDIRWSCANIDRAREIFGYAPSVSLRDGLKEMVGEVGES